MNERETRLQNLLIQALPFVRMRIPDDYKPPCPGPDAQYDVTDMEVTWILGFIEAVKEEIDE